MTAISTKILPLNLNEANIKESFVTIACLCQRTKKIKFQEWPQMSLSNAKLRSHL